MTPSGDGPEQGADPITLRFGHGLPLDSPGTEMFRKLFDQIAIEADGKIAVKMVAFSMVGLDASDTLSIVATGEHCDFALLFPPYVAPVEPLFEVGVVPLHGLVAPDDNAAVIDVQRDIAREILADWDLEAFGFQHVSGAEKRVYMFSKTALRSLDDLRGRRLRHWSAMSAEAFRALGVKAEVLPAKDTYRALRDGQIDAALLPLNYAISESLQDVTTHVVDMAPFISSTPTCMIASQPFWAELPDGIRAAFDTAFVEHYDHEKASYEADEAEPELLRGLAEKGMICGGPFPERDRAALQMQVLRCWRNTAELIGPRAVEFHERLEARLPPTHA